MWSTDLRRVFHEVAGKPVFGIARQRRPQALRGTRRAPDPGDRGQIVTLSLITALLTTTLCIIRHVDRPLGGMINVHPTATEEAERQATRDFLAHHTPQELPCDTQGNHRDV
ncbi:hypothetical protein [Streptomyces sp. NPDC054863]